MLGCRPRSSGSRPRGRTRPRPFSERDLSGTDYVWPWIDGIDLKLRLEQEKLCLLMMIGVCADGRKKLVALTDGYREIDRVGGRTAAVVSPPRYDRLGAGRRRRGAGVREGCAGGVPGYP